jgi:hypothetical protein
MTSRQRQTEEQRFSYEESTMMAGIAHHRFLRAFVGAIIPLSIVASSCAHRDAGGKYANYEEIVTETHAASLRMRQEALRGYLNTTPETRFPNIPKWGGTLWSMVALYLDERTDRANPRNQDPGSNDRYLLHAGDIQSYGTLDDFVARVVQNSLSVKDGEVSYSVEAEGIDLVMFSYDPGKPEDFRMPLINGEELDLSPDWTYKSPYINSPFKEKKVTVTVGPVTEIYDFGDGL